MFWRVVYGLATGLALPFVLVYFYWRGRREPAYRRHWRERLGYVGELPEDPIWVHAASVGEVMLVAPLVAALRKRYPQCPLLLTTMTPTGRERAQARFGNEVIHRYVPLDTRAATRRFMCSTGPRLAVFAETELWPQLIAAAADRNVPIVLVNASLSKRSAMRHARWPLASASRFMLEHIAAIGAASEVHAERFRALGAPAARVRVTGNLKYDVGDAASQIEAGRRLRTQWQTDTRPIWVAASTHEGEETQLVEAFAQLRRRHPTALMVIAPRHPQRFDAVNEQLGGSGWRLCRRSTGDGVTSETDIVLADTLGEVPIFYAAADVVFVGGSLVPGVGGHNVIEAAVIGRPLCVGPYISEWRDIIDALTACHAARVCDGPRPLAEQVGAWLDDREAAMKAGSAGARLVQSNQGALARTLSLIETARD